MAKKDDLIEEAKCLGIELDSNETVADLQAKIAAAKDAAQAPVEGEVKRYKVNRGSRRRIERALSTLNAALDAAIKELDMQAFVADDEGNRTGEWPAVTMLREAKDEANNQVNQLLAG